MVDASLEIEIVKKLLFMLNKEGIPILFEDLIVDKIELGFSFCVLGSMHTYTPDPL